MSSPKASLDGQQGVSGASGYFLEGVGDEIFRSLSRAFSGRSQETTEREREEQAEEKDGPISVNVEEWHLLDDVRQAKIDDPADGRRLGVTWSNLTVKGVEADAIIHENVISQFDVPRLVKQARRAKPMKTIIDSSSGCVKPGEMLLVLGRPESGCTTLLKMLANRRKG
jgi:ABC-type glutathione transport system ATPase component